MPSVAEEQPRLTMPGRKRRRDNDVNDLQIQGPLYEKLAQYSAAAVASTNWNADAGVFGRPIQQQLHHQQPNFFPQYPSNGLIFQHGGLEGNQQHTNLDAVPRKIAPLPGAKRQRMFDEEEDNGPWGADSTTSPQRQRRSSKSPSARVLQDQTDAGNRPKTPSLSPCHICHRRPTKKSDLDSFADCQGCGQRTCYVCIRQCKGWNRDGRPSEGDEPEREDDLSRSFHMDDVDDERQRQKSEEHDVGRAKRQDGWTGGGHRTMICSRCCIESGTEGEPVCLGCLSRMESV
ncbi:hypothetical protein CkaCkLH20_03515 [Colletotrichum karsti]|uniref:Uncharacterized protein n=1 Tax=Colletotrichum karsti TaxID=1095194 RepID=A0A9P6I9E5_9PEZI|nr:uncharacterized protein CkaCkLH20_03515 [Colletotrichum karsti]KAF9879282.1 hypothetical protein CkaCkLH20_03515 [Colletotrichum karsti]